jgi:hypothetical protein
MVALCAGLHSCSGGKDGSGLPSLRENYVRNDTRPFGGYTAYRLLSALYPGVSNEPVKESIAETRKNSYDTGALYVSISEYLYTSDEDVTALKSYINAGNDVFLAAAEFDDNLLDEVACGVVNNTQMQDILQVKMSPTSVRLDSRYYNDSADYRYFYKPMSNYFSQLPKGESIVLGRNEDGKPNFVVVFIGGGRLFLHCEPRALSNYFLLQRNNHRYFEQLMAYTKVKPERLVWNDYYAGIRSRRSGSGEGSLFDGLNGGLKTAFWLFLLLLALYIIYGVKRLQRIMPVRTPNENTTVAFAETVGLLYLQKKDNKNIADKMITYFSEFVRNQYFLNTNHPNSDFITVLSRKSGVPHEKVEALYRTIANMQQTQQVDDYQLLSLNQQIQNFYKLRN